MHNSVQITEDYGNEDDDETSINNEIGNELKDTVEALDFTDLSTADILPIDKTTASRRRRWSDKQLTSPFNHKLISWLTQL